MPWDDESIENNFETLTPKELRDLGDIKVHPTNIIAIFTSIPNDILVPLMVEVTRDNYAADAFEDYCDARYAAQRTIDGLNAKDLLRIDGILDD